jgi:hypothetical protein
MFRFLVDASSGCQTGVHYHVDLREFVALARRHDSATLDVKALPLGGVVFHESRCGSTLVANALSAMNPTTTRVYSESAPPIAALHMVCGETYTSCSLEQAAKVLSDTMYAMSRTRDLREQHVFFKIQSLGTRNLPVFQAAFPDTPWIFVYRDPVQVMMSQLKGGSKYANCVRPRHLKNVLVSDLVRRHGRRVSELSDEEYCAAHLATLTEAAVDALQTKPRRGRPVNYESLPDSLYQDILPNHFGIPLSSEEIDNIRRISSVYSKGVGGRQGEFKSDSVKKEKLASQQVRDASKLFLDESYQTLQQGGILVDKQEEAEEERRDEEEHEKNDDKVKRREETTEEEEETDNAKKTEEEDEEEHEEEDEEEDEEEEEEEEEEKSNENDESDKEEDEEKSEEDDKSEEKEGNDKNDDKEEDNEEDKKEGND